MLRSSSKPFIRNETHFDQTDQHKHRQIKICKQPGANWLVWQTAESHVNFFRVIHLFRINSEKQCY